VRLPDEDAALAQPGYTWSFLYRLLAQLPPNVHAVTVVHRQLLDALQSRLAANGWAQLDQLLMRSGFRALEEVTIRADWAALRSSQEAQGFWFFSSDDLWEYLAGCSEQMKLFFKQKLPQLDARGILLVG
jgi:hypothetical protein